MTPSAYARSGEGGSAGTSSTARSNAARHGIVTAGLVEVLAKAHVEEPRTAQVFAADELDRSPAELDRARGGTDLARPARPSSEHSSARSIPASSAASGRRPTAEGPLEVRVGLGEAEDGLGLARRFDRGDERLRVAARRRPVRRELGCRSSVACERVCEPRVQLLALAGQDRRVDRLGEERVAEAEGAARLVGDEDAVLDRLAQRLAQLGLRQPAIACSSG